MEILEGALVFHGNVSSMVCLTSSMMYEVGGIVNKLLLYKPMSSSLVNHLYLEILMHSASICSELPHNRTKH